MCLWRRPLPSSALATADRSCENILAAPASALLHLRLRRTLRLRLELQLGAPLALQRAFARPGRFSPRENDHLRCGQARRAHWRRRSSCDQSTASREAQGPRRRSQLFQLRRRSYAHAPQDVGDRSAGHRQAWTRSAFALTLAPPKSGLMMRPVSDRRRRAASPWRSEHSRSGPCRGSVHIRRTFPSCSARAIAKMVSPGNAPQSPPPLAKSRRCGFSPSPRSVRSRSTTERSSQSLNFGTQGDNSAAYAHADRRHVGAKPPVASLP